jgi:hypothetical protein
MFVILSFSFYREGGLVPRRVAKYFQEIFIAIAQRRSAASAI